MTNPIHDDGLPHSLREILDQPPYYPHSLVGGGLLYENTKMIIYGRYKSLKSMMGLDLAFALAGGTQWIGFDTPKEGSKVLYLQLELSAPLFRSRLTKTWSFRETMMDSELSNSVARKNLHFWTQHWLKIDQPQGVAILDHYLEEIQPDVLIVDPLYKVVTGNLLTVLDMQKLVDALDILIGKHECSVILISHTRKGLMGMEEWGSDDLIGSFVFSAWADTVLKVERKGGDRLSVKFDVVRHAEEEIEPKEVQFNRDTLELTVVEPLIRTPTETSTN